MGTTFSISLPMQRIPQNVLDTIENNPAFGRYANPAVSRRISHDLLRSSQKVTSQKNASSKSNSNESSFFNSSTNNSRKILKKSNNVPPKSEPVNENQLKRKN